MSGNGLKLYADKVSPVCRSIMVLLASNGIPHNFVYVSLKAGDTRTNQEFIATNPNKRIPSIDDNGFTLFESVAILRYLCQKYKLPDHWYPSDLQVRARVDEALAWFPGNLRCGCFFHTALAPIKYSRPRDNAKCAETLATLRESLDIVESYFLKDKKFVAGDEISIADLQFLGEVTQYWIADCDIYKGRPNMERWVDNCQKVLAPHFDQIFDKVLELRTAGTYRYPIDTAPTSSKV